MARIAAILPAGSRITDSVSLGVVAKTFPIDTVRSALSVTGRASIRERDLPAHVMMYYVIALALYMQQCSAREVLRCLLEGIQWLLARWRADPASRKPARGSDGSRCANCTTKWCGQSQSKRRGGPGIGNGGWSAWMAAHLM